MIRLRGLIVCVMAILIGQTTSVWSQSTMFFPLEDVKSGMKGYGLTVFQGTDIDTFQVEILGVMKNIFYAKHDLIMVRASGPYVDKAGIIAGMSGSPVYIDGKLIGALAYRFGQMAKEPIGAVTPIEQMLAITTAANTGRSGELDSVGELYGGGSEMRNVSASGVFGGSDGQFLQPISVPVVFSGFAPATVRLFEDRFRAMGLTPVLGGGSDPSPAVPGEAPTLLPGSSVGVQLVRGNMSIAATGTVTYRDGDTILAFGHPFLWSGAINVPMTTAEIVTVIPDLASSTKISNVRESVGSILWDHTNGLYGKLGAASHMIPMRIDFKSGDLFRETYEFEVMMANAWTPILVNMTVANTILANGRLGGERTIRLDGRVSMRDHQDILLQDLFSGELSMPAVTNDIMNVLSVVFDNPFVTPNIESIDLAIHSTDDRRTAVIEDVWFDKEEVVPGEPLQVRIFLRPYRGERIMKTVAVSIPSNISDRDVQVVVGTARSLTQQEIRTTPQRFRPQEVDQLIALLNKRRTNNAVYVKVYQMNMGGILKGHEMPTLPPSVLAVMNSSRVNGSFTPIHEVVIAEQEIQTEYVIAGQIRARFKVKR